VGNYVHDNNDPNVPAIGDAAIGPVGTGIVLAGDRNNIITNNTFADNDAWGVLTTVFPDTGAENPNNTSNCHGGVLGGTVAGQTFPCLFDDWGNQVVGNTFSGNGGYGNVTNGDLADLSVVPVEQLGAPGNCFSGNHQASGAPASTWPLLLQTLQASCTNPLGYPDAASTTVLAAQVGCATQALFQCPSTVVANYPRQTQVVMPAMPPQTTMPNPCVGVPDNPWCDNGTPVPPAKNTAVAGALHDARLPESPRVVTG
jgi:hypothetical protein